MASNTLPKRSEIDEKYKWKLEDIYDSREKWEEDFEK
jgi:oligoendopeptidase F